MPFTPPPQNPNFVPGNGARLVVDRFDFESHLQGVNPPNATNFRHTAAQIDLSPALVIGSASYTDAQDAIAALADIIITSTTPPATIGTFTPNLGTVTLGGDFGGTALIPRLTHLQGFPLSLTSPPDLHNVLTWNGSQWVAASAQSAGGAVTGTIELQSGASLISDPGSTINIHGNFLTDTWATWNTPQTRSLVRPIVSGTYGSLLTDWNVTVDGITSDTTGAVWIIPVMDMHHGATLSSVTFYFIVNNAHAGGVPANFPAFAVSRFAYNSDTQVFLYSGISHSPTAATGAAWHDGGAVQSFTFTCDQNNVIDNTVYRYNITIQDEHGANSQTGNTYVSYVLNFTGIVNQSWSI